MKTPIYPLEGKLTVKPLGKEERKTDSGIIIATGSAEVERFIPGKVIAAATHKYVGEKLVPMSVKRGMIILFDEHMSKEFDFNGQKYYCVEENKCYGVLSEEAIKYYKDEE